MSHYSVAVFSDGSSDLEEMLAPFNEYVRVPHYISRTDIIAKVRNEIETYKNTTYAEYLKDPQTYIAKYPKPNHIKYITEEFPKKLDWTDEDCYRDGIRFYEEENIKPDGSVFDNCNPNAKWDWYEIGGRFSKIIPLKDGSYADEASMCDVDISHHDEERYRKALRLWRLCVEEQTSTNEEDKELIRFAYKKEYYTERYKSAEEYADWVSGFTFYAALLPNGEWLEPGQMGWWGISSAKAEDDIAWRKQVHEILKQAQKKNWQVTIVDCHI